MITSRNNPRIKNIVKLRKASERKKQNLIIIEGEREIIRAVKSGFILETLFICPAIANTFFLDQLSESHSRQYEMEEVTKDVFDKIAYREGSDGLMALAIPKSTKLSDIHLKANPLIIILEAVEKPGNLGAVLRTADAANVDAVIICDPKTDVWNPNTIRSSIGCVFTTQVATCTNDEAFAWLRKNNITSFATSLEASDHYLKSDFTKPSAIVMGTEATGLSDNWTQNSDHRIIIPMRGIADSLNVSTSTAIVVFEALRQREDN